MIGNSTFKTTGEIILILLLVLLQASNYSSQGIKRDSKPLFSKQKIAALDSLSCSDIKWMGEMQFVNFVKLHDLRPYEIYQYCKVRKDTTLTSQLATYFCNCLENDQEEPNADYYGSILYPPEGFWTDVLELKEVNQLTFMDVGCGNGEKLFLALNLGFRRVYGLEYADHLVKMSKRNFPMLNQRGLIEIEHADALTIHPSYYSKADFVYTYSPIKNPQIMSKLFYKIVRHLKDDAIVLGVEVFLYLEELQELTHWDLSEVVNFLAVKRKNDELLRYSEKDRSWYPLTLLDGQLTKANM